MRKIDVVAKFIEGIVITVIGIVSFVFGIGCDRWGIAFTGSHITLMGALEIKTARDMTHLPTSGPKDEEEFEHEEQ